MPTAHVIWFVNVIRLDLNNNEYIVWTWYRIIINCTARGNPSANLELLTIFFYLEFICIKKSEILRLLFSSYEIFKFKLYYDVIYLWNKLCTKFWFFEIYAMKKHQQLGYIDRDRFSSFRGLLGSKISTIYVREAKICDFWWSIFFLVNLRIFGGVYFFSPFEDIWWSIFFLGFWGYLLEYIFSRHFEDFWQVKCRQPLSERLFSISWRSGNQFFSSPIYIPRVGASP